MWWAWYRVLVRPSRRKPGARGGTRGEAARRGAEVICLPELFLTSIFCQREDPSLVRSAGGDSGAQHGTFLPAGRELHAPSRFSLFERRASGALSHTPSSSAAMAKFAVCTARCTSRRSLYYEKYYFTPGDLGFKSFDLEVGSIGTLVAGIMVSGGARLTPWRAQT